MTKATRKATRKTAAVVLVFSLLLSAVQPAFASGVTYMPDVTAEMCTADYWMNFNEDADEVILTQEEIKALNLDSHLASGTMILDLRTAKETYNGITRNASIRSSATNDAQYYYGWTYQSNGEKADWDYYQKMIDNCIDPNATEVMQVRYGIAVNRTVLQTFPSSNAILDDPKDYDFDYQYLTSICINEPMLVYNTSADGRFYMVRVSNCSGWVPARDVAICADKEEWLSAWDIPDENKLVILENSVYTASSNTHIATARRLLTQGTTLELITDWEPGQLITNRSPYHNYAVYLPVRNRYGMYEKHEALVPQNIDASIGYLPLTKRNIARVAMHNLGDAYGWGGMLNEDDCTGMTGNIYSCFGLEVARNGTWQWNMNIEKIDMTNMSLEEKCKILDQLPFGTALSLPGHQMMYLGKVDGKYYVLSTVSSIVSPDTGEVLRTRDVMINTLDVRRSNGKSWIGSLNRVFMLYYPTDTDRQFTVPSLEWYHDGVAFCMAHNILSSDIDGKFGIGSVVTSQEFEKALAMMHNGEIVEEKEDAQADKLPKSITRLEAVIGLWTLEQQQNRKIDAPLVAPEGFPEAMALEGDAYKAVEWAYSEGILAGVGDGSFDLDQRITREQLAVMFYRYHLLPETEAV